MSELTRFVPMAVSEGVIRWEPFSEGVDDDLTIVGYQDSDIAALRTTITQQAQELERLKRDVEKYKALLLQSCTDNTEEYGVECKPNCDSYGHEDDCPVSHPGMVFTQLRQQLATSQARCEEETNAAIIERADRINAQAQLKQLQATLAEREGEVNQLNNVLRQAGWGQGEIDSAAYTFDKMAEANRTLIKERDTARQDAARLREALEALWRLTENHKIQDLDAHAIIEKALKGGA